MFLKSLDFFMQDIFLFKNVFYLKTFHSFKEDFFFPVLFELPNFSFALEMLGIVNEQDLAEKAFSHSRLLGQNFFLKVSNAPPPPILLL